MSLKYERPVTCGTEVAPLCFATYPQRTKLVFEVRLCECEGGRTSDVCVLQFCHKIVHYLENRINKLRIREMSGYRNGTNQTDPLSEVGLKCVTSVI